MSGWQIAAVGLLTATAAVAVHAQAAGRLAHSPHSRVLLGQRRAYALSALAAAALGTLLAWRLGPGLLLVLLCCLAAAAPALSWLDVLERRLPNALTVGLYPLMVALVAAGALSDGSSRPALNAGIGLLLVGGFFLLVAVMTAGGLGFGDVKLAGLTGLVIGVQSVSHAALSMMLSLLIGALLGALAIAPQKRSSAPAAIEVASAHVALGPAILAGAFLAATLTF